MDTVFPKDTAFRHFRQDSAHCHGPGVYDMKGGLVVALYALKALEHLGLLADLPVTVLCNSDEEIGSPASRAWIEEQTRNALAALVFEGAGPEREVVTGRKGRMGLNLTVHGRAGHAAAGGDKSSAILELAHKIIALENLNGVAGATLNVGQVSGGIGPNTVPDRAEAELDVRLPDQRTQDLIGEAIRKIAERSTIPGTRAELSTVGGRPPMPQSDGNRRLYAVARKHARRFGYELPEELRSGVSDANFIGALGVPVLDGLGPVGGLDHSDREFIVGESLAERAALTAAIIAEILEKTDF
jgi:glutamate carboxypeptidase